MFIIVLFFVNILDALLYNALWASFLLKAVKPHFKKATSFSIIALGMLCVSVLYAAEINPYLELFARTLIVWVVGLIYGGGKRFMRMSLHIFMFSGVLSFLESLYHLIFLVAVKAYMNIEGVLHTKALFPMYMLLLSVCFLLKRVAGAVFNKNIFSFLNIELSNTKTLLLLLLNIAAMPLFFALSRQAILTQYGSNNADHAGNLLLIALSAGVLYLALILSIIKRENYKIMIEAVNLNIKNIENANRELRAFKHDVLNHFQVVSAMIQNKKYDAAKNYILSLQDAKLQVKNAGTCSIAISSLFDAKKKAAQQAGISFVVDILIPLEKLCALSDYVITTVLGNIIDNAIYEESASPSREKFVGVTLAEDTENFLFSIYNKNSYISSDIANKIFTPGFTTKGHSGEGIGLYTVFNLVKKMRGDVQIKSAPDSGTEFTVIIPKQSSDIPLL